MLSTREIDTSDPLFLKWKRLHVCVSKLESVNTMTSHMSFFAVLAAVDLKIKEHEANEPLIIAMVVTTSLLVAITMCVKFVASNILPSIQSIAEMTVAEDIHRSPHEHLIYFINITWIFANIVCPCLFAIDLALLCWLQFELISMTAVYASTGIMLTLLIIFLVFGVIFFRQKIPYKRRRNQHLKEIIRLVHGVTGIIEYNSSRRRYGSMMDASTKFKPSDDFLRSDDSDGDKQSSCSTSTGSASNSISCSSTDLVDTHVKNESENVRRPILRKSDSWRSNVSYGSMSSSPALTPNSLINPALYFYSPS